MSIGVSVARLASLAAISVLTLAAQGSGGRSCWLRDAANPGGPLVHAVCEQGSIWTTTDGGATWQRRETGAPERVRGIAFLDANRGIIIGNRGMVMATEDGAKTWQARKVDVKEHLMDIALSGENGWIVGYQGVILRTKDGGRTWEKQNANTKQTLETVFFLDANRGWAVGWSGTILRTTDGGQKWDVVRCDEAQWSLTSVYFRDPQNGWMVGFAGQILRSKDGGATWQVQSSPVKNWLTNVTFDSTNQGWVTYDDGLLLSQDGGETWKAMPAGGRYFLGKLTRVDKTLWAVGQSTVLRLADNRKWVKIESLSPNTTTAPSSAPAATPGKS
jgi:photosystem II stability/assembly factor-like uncharacterized protein